MTPTRKQDGELAKKLDVAIDGLRRWRADPVAFVREVLGATPDEWQADALMAFADPKQKRHALVACKGPGKTTALSWMGWNFLLTRPHCKVPCSSITGDNLKDGLWAEFSKWQKRSPLLMRGFAWTKTRIFQRENPETWFASGRGWAKDADPKQQANTIAGVHEDYLLWLLDEVSEMPDGVVSAAEGALTGGIETKLAIAGNCTKNEGPLYRAAVSERKHWKVTRITGDPDDPKRSPRIDIEECRTQIAKYGRDSYVVQVNILGVFPDRQADKLLDRRDVDTAMKRVVFEQDIERQPRVIGVDVARQGDDASVFAPRQGRLLFAMKEFRAQRSDQLGDHLISSLNKWSADAAFVDCNPSGVRDHCISLGYGEKVHDVNFGESALDKALFENRRAEMHWLMAEWVKTGGALPNDQLLAEELCAPIYWYDKKQRICIESKDDIKARLGRSPDRADALALTFAAPVAPRMTPAQQIAQGIQQLRPQTYDPFAPSREEYDPFARS